MSWFPPETFSDSITRPETPTDLFGRWLLVTGAGEEPTTSLELLFRSKLSQIRRFLWSGDENKRGFAKVSWDKVVTPLHMGGLGVFDLYCRNIALILKRVWVLISGEENVWTRMIRRKYGILSLGDVLRIDYKKCSPIWAGIFELCQKDAVINKQVRELIRVQIGTGRQTRFWLDKWAGPVPLAEAFPYLFSKVRHEQATVADIGAWENQRWRWSIDLKVEATAAERVLWSHMCMQIAPIVPKEGADRVMWTEEESGQYSVMSSYQYLLQHTKPPWTPPTYGTVWNTSIPHRICFFVWLLMEESLSTKVFLVRRHLMEAEASTCSRCSMSAETHAHLFLHCSKSSVIWTGLLDRIGVAGVLTGTTQEWWNGWEELLPNRNKEARRFWRILAYAVLWTMWNFRNAQLFRGDEGGDLMKKALSLWYHWIRASTPRFPYTNDEVVRSAQWLLSWGSNPIA